MGEVLELGNAPNKVMTVKEVAAAIGVPYPTVARNVRELFPDAVQNGKTTLLNESQVATLSKSLKMSHNSHIGTDKVTFVTDLELLRDTQQLLQRLAVRVSQLEQENEILKARVGIADSFRTVDRYISENNIDLQWCEDNGLGKGLVGIGLKLSKWFKSLPPEQQQGAVTEVNLGKYLQKSYRMDILDAYFDVD